MKGRQRILRVFAPIGLLALLAACDPSGPEPPDPAFCDEASHGARTCGGTAIYLCAAIESTFEWYEETDCRDRCEELPLACGGNDDYVVASCAEESSPKCRCRCEHVSDGGR